MTEAGVRQNIQVAMRYLDIWLRGQGAAAIDHLMEDAATAEISRSQLWQWINQGMLTERGHADRGREGSSTSSSRAPRRCPVGRRQPGEGRPGDGC